MMFVLVMMRLPLSGLFAASKPDSKLGEDRKPGPLKTSGTRPINLPLTTHTRTISYNLFLHCFVQLGYMLHCEGKAISVSFRLIQA